MQHEAIALLSGVTVEEISALKDGELGSTADQVVETGDAHVRFEGERSH